MRPDLVRLLARAAHRLARRWPREPVLRSTGEPVRVIDRAERPDGRTCLVETASGELLRVRPEQLASRLRLVPEDLLLQLALALAASVATLAVLAAR